MWDTFIRTIIFDAKAVHDILFYPQNSQYEIDDKENKYYKALKEIVENDNEIHVRIKRQKWLPRFINDYWEGKVVKPFLPHDSTVMS